MDQQRLQYLEHGRQLEPGISSEFDCRNRQVRRTGSQTNVSLNNSYTVKALEFSGTTAYTIGGSYELYLQANSGVSYLQQTSNVDQTLSVGMIDFVTNSVLDVTGSGNLLITSPFDTGTATLTKVGGGTAVLSGNNSSYSGIIYVNDGNLRIRSNNALGATSATAYTLVNDGASLQLRITSRRRKG